MRTFRVFRINRRLRPPCLRAYAEWGGPPRSFKPYYVCSVVAPTRHAAEMAAATLRKSKGRGLTVLIDLSAIAG